MILLEYYPKAEKLIIDEYYFTGAQGVIGSLESSVNTSIGDVPRMKEDLLPDNVRATTFCILALENGYCVTGSFTFLSTEDMDETEGKELARKDAVLKLLPLINYMDKQEEHDRFKL